MATGFTNTTSAETSTFGKGMVKDNNELFLTDGMWHNAINAINNSHIGDGGTLGNEPSNQLCTTLPYTILGYAHIRDTRYVMFSGDNVNSEIGIFDEKDCSYTKSVNDKCLGFKLSHLITAVVKENYDCTFSVYFQDGLNYDRTLNLDKTQEYYKVDGDSNLDPDCYEPHYTTELDCNKLRLHPIIKQPCVNVTRSQGAGQLQNGSYVALIAYSENGIKLTDYSMPSAPQPLWDHTGVGGSIDITVSDLDTNFNEFELVIVQTVNQNASAKKIGNYSITHNAGVNSTKINLDVILLSLPAVDMRILPLKSVIYDKSDKMFTLNNYLIRSGVTTEPVINYQPLANKIKTEWVAVKYDSDYYWNGGHNVSYLRDEVYSFFIRWVYNTGARSASYHIPGRAAVASDLVIANTADVVYSKNKAWQVYDTSTSGFLSGTADDGIGEFVNKGNMAYWESTEKYPNDKPEIWGDLCGKNVRHHKMPSNETTHIHEVAGLNTDSIKVLGVKFSNIAKPVDSTGAVISEIIGYEILRGSREGNKSIVAKGMFNNIWEYKIRKTNLTKKGLFQNYPYNDLRPDPFIVRTEDYGTHILQGGENDSAGQNLTTYRKDMFSFHSPETTFAKPYIGNNFVKLYKEEQATVSNQFQFPHKHPKYVMITDFAMVAAAICGIGIGLVAALGSSTTQSTEEVSFFGLAGTQQAGGRGAGEGSAIMDTIAGNITNIKGIAGLIFGAVIFAANFMYFAGQGTDKVLETIRKICKKRQYVLQLNSHGFYRNSANVLNSASAPYTSAPSIIREVKPSKIKYIGSGIHDFDATYRINNLYRTKYVALELKADVPNPWSTTDNSKATLANMGMSYRDGNITKEFQTSSVAYYGAIKMDYDNQYGQLGSIIQIPVASCVNSGTESPVIFGGDTYINRYTEKNAYMFFDTWLMGEPDGTEFDYRNYINGPLPRYWANFEKFDLDDLGFSTDAQSDDYNDDDDDGNSEKAKEKKGFFKRLKDFKLTSPSDFHRFDRSGKHGVLSVKWAYMYLSANGIRDFFCESEFNLAYRDYGEDTTQKFFDPYGNSFNDSNLMFRSDLIVKPTFFKYDLSLSASKLYNNFTTWGAILQKDYDPKIYASCFEYYPDRVIYSLQQQSGLKRDNWRNFLPLNYKDFKGKICSIKAMNATGAIILFEDAEPVSFTGVDQLQTTGGVKVTIGDGGLFAQNMQSLANADDVLEYGACINSRSAVNTPFGLFYISQKAGKILQSNGGSLDEISRNGMKYWFMEHLPSKLLTAFPDCELYDNPVVGIGCQAVYDAQYEIVYFTKKDYMPLRPEAFLFDDISGVPYYLTENTNLKRFVPFSDTASWQDCSWTISYDPKTKMFVSFHEWIPQLAMPSYKHFFTMKNRGIWRHNSTWDSYCNYYGTDYPWEVEFPVVTPNAVNSIRNVEYFLDTVKYYNNGDDFHHLLDENFDRAIVFNSEQVSGILKLSVQGKNSPLHTVNYPQIGLNGISILYSKEEQKYRFNQFWDVTKDRGEFTGLKIPIWLTDCAGFRRTLNPSALDYMKPAVEHKKFRHFANRVILRKLVSGDKKMILKLVNVKLLSSTR